MTNLPRLDNLSQEIPLFGKYHMRGLLTVRQKDGSRKGLYIAEYVTQEDPNLPINIAIYGVTEIKNGNDVSWDKAYELKKTSVQRYKENTFLGRLLAGTTKDNTKVKEVKEYFPPKFITTITEGVDSITGRKGPGFWEETPGRYDAKTKGYTAGERTGVFLGLSSFKWGNPTYRSKDLKDFYSQYQLSTERNLFNDFI